MRSKNVTEGIAWRTNIASDKLFLAFTGNAHRLMMDPLAFFKVTGIGFHNIGLFRDSSMRGYQQGISEEISTLDELVELIQRELDERFKHVRHIFAIGTSSGGYPAIYCGNRLSARCIWTFGGRVCKLDAVPRRDSELRKLFSRVTGHTLPNKLSVGLPDILGWAEWRSFLTTARGRDEVRNISENSDVVLDFALLQEMVLLMARADNSSHLHLYYSPQNTVDSQVAALFKEVSLARLFPIHSEISEAEDLDVFGRSSSHVVAQLLYEQGLLSSVFQGYI